MNNPAPPPIFLALSGYRQLIRFCCGSAGHGALGRDSQCLGVLWEALRQVKIIRNSHE